MEGGCFCHSQVYDSTMTSIYLCCVLIKCMKTFKREAGKVQHPGGHGEADREADYTLS